jgi:hypothetical protein
MKKTLFITISLCGILFFSCKKKETKPDTNTEAMISLPEDFRAFYENFHTDSLFQIRHTAFPLKGLPINADSLTLASDNFFHEEKDWKMQRAIDFSKGEFIQTMIPLTDRIVTERILKADNQFGIERRFAKLSDGEWNLIYYCAPNRFTIIQK